MLRIFIAKATLLSQRRAHHELSRRHDHHLGTVLGTLSKSVPRLERLLPFGSEHVGPNLSQHVGTDGAEPTPLLPQEVLIQPAEGARENGQTQHAKGRLGALPTFAASRFAWRHAARYCRSLGSRWRQGRPVRPAARQFSAARLHE